MNWHLDFAPLLSWPFIVTLGGFAVLIASLLVLTQTRGAWLRSLALSFALLALINPELVREEREPLTSVAALVIDRSDSQKLGKRDEQTDRITKALTERLANIKNLETRIVETDGRDPSRAGTALFGELERSLSDVPPDRIAGAILITDGQIHDALTSAEQLAFDAPLHTVLTGEDDEYDLRLVLNEAPRFGIVNEDKRIKFRIEATQNVTISEARVTLQLNGEHSMSEMLPIGTDIELDITIDRGGENILEITVDELEGELTTLNNTAIQTIEGIRENLRVLLVSGEPHPGERTWRNLLKSDATVDLVHFTILRPPEKQDGTPINQLSLIAFPTRELFAVKINEFDLIIFDRYQRRGVLPMLYFDNIARYVQEGGAVLVAAGPDYADSSSIYQTPLAPILPAAPIGSVFEDPFHATITQEGFRHPVTRNLEGAKATPPEWSRWFRSIDVENPRGNIIMHGEDERPLLILNREQEGRVALMLSDHAWLWARGFEGGGPHVQLLRRLAHWLMKEPDLEEEALRGFAEGDALIIERQTMAETDSNSDAPPSAVQITRPDGENIELAMENVDAGLRQGKIEDAPPGLYEVVDGDLKILTHMGPPNPEEFQDVISTGEKLETVTTETGGRIIRADTTIPRILALKGASGNRVLGGRDWMGLKMSDASILKGVDRVSLFAGFLGLALLLGAFASMWYREGR